MKNRTSCFDSRRISEEILRYLESHKGEKYKSPEDMFDKIFEYENTHAAWYENDSMNNAREDINDNCYFFCAIAVRYDWEWGHFTSFAEDIVKFHCEVMCFVYHYIIRCVSYRILPSNRKRIELSDEFLNRFRQELDCMNDDLIDDYECWTP